MTNPFRRHRTKFLWKRDDLRQARYDHFAIREFTSSRRKQELKLPIRTRDQSLACCDMGIKGQGHACCARRTGIRVVGEMSWEAHFCHFYETKEDLLNTLVPYFKAGLEDN